MAKIICFSSAGFNGTSKEYYSNDPDLALNNDDFTIASAIVISGTWTLYDEPNNMGTSQTLNESGGPESDGCYKDHADWGGAADFHVKAIQHS